MSERGFQIRNQQEIHFITFSVVEWVDACLPVGKYLHEVFMSGSPPWFVSSRPNKITTLYRRIFIPLYRIVKPFRRHFKD